jgi:hypothetical protein
MPVFIFNFLMGVWFQTHMFVKAHMALTLILASFYLFFGMYRNPNASSEAFTGSFLIGMSCFLIKPLVVLLPVFWIGFMMFQSFSLRTWLASLFGFLNPLIFYFAASFYLNPEALTAENLLSGLIPIQKTGSNTTRGFIRKQLMPIRKLPVNASLEAFGLRYIPKNR